MGMQKLKKEIKSRRFHRIFFFVSYLSPIVFLKHKQTTINKGVIFFSCRKYYTTLCYQYVCHEERAYILITLKV